METEPNLVKLCRRVASEHSAEKHNWTSLDGKRRKTLVDASSANLVVTVWGKLNEANRQKWAVLANKNPVLAINALWKLM